MTFGIVSNIKVMEFSLPKLIFVISLCSFFYASFSQNDDPIPGICKKSRSPNFCFEFYKSDHGEIIQDLALKAVNNAEYTSYTMYALLNNLVSNSPDPALKGNYETCWENYNSAISLLQLASRSLNDPKGFSGKLFNAQYAVAECHKGLGGIPGIGGSPVKPPQLNDGNERISNLCSIAIIISNLL